MGGGGFSMEPENPLLDDHVLSLATRPRGRDGLPRLCFLPTASGDQEGYVEEFEAAFADRAEISVLTLFSRDQPGHDDLRTLLLAQDVVYVGGGSTANLLALWRLHGLGDVLAEAAARGTVLAGISAGMNCWFEASVTDSFGPMAPLADGLGLLTGSACPHYHSEEERRPLYLDLVGRGELPAGFAADDGAALHFADGDLVEAVSSAPGARAYRVHRVTEGAAATESALAVRYLGG